VRRAAIAKDRNAAPIDLLRAMELVVYGVNRDSPMCGQGLRDRFSACGPSGSAPEAGMAEGNEEGSRYGVSGDAAVSDRAAR
jgi:hypothetical protein